MDEYRLTEERADDGRTATHSTPAPADVAVRTLLWCILVVSATANAASSLMGLHPLIAACFGLVTVIAIVALILRHLRARTR